MKSDVKISTKQNLFINELFSENDSLGEDFKNFLISIGIELEREGKTEKKIGLSDLIRITDVFFKYKNQKKLAALDQFNLKSIDYSIIEHLLAGKSNKEIALNVQLSEQAVKYHLGKNFKKFQVKNREQFRIRLKHLLESSSS